MAASHKAELEISSPTTEDSVLDRAGKEVLRIHATRILGWEDSEAHVDQSWTVVCRNHGLDMLLKVDTNF